MDDDKVTPSEGSRVPFCQVLMWGSSFGTCVGAAVAVLTIRVCRVYTAATMMLGYGGADDAIAATLGDPRPKHDPQRSGTAEKATEFWRWS